MTSRETRHFTLDEANRTLPFVRRVVSDIVVSYRSWKQRVYQYELVAAESNTTVESQKQRKLREEIDEVAQRINHFVAELEPIGCVFKGFDDGLVDFHSEIDGRDVLLCWKLGEESVEHWHEIDAGFAGRQQLVTSVGTGEGE